MYLQCSYESVGLWYVVPLVVKEDLPALSREGKVLVYLGNLRLIFLL